MEFGQLLRDIGVDEKATLERFGGMSELLKKFILKFPEDPTYGRLVNVIENGVLEDVEREVHTLKGLTANLGISGLNQICSECLDYLRQRKTTLLPELYLRIQEEYDRVVELISEYHSLKRNYIHKVSMSTIRALFCGEAPVCVKIIALRLFFPLWSGRCSGASRCRPDGQFYHAALWI